jgi:hypothetical protein
MDLAVGTHALISEDAVQFGRLRCGRSSTSSTASGWSSGLPSAIAVGEGASQPDVLVMTATPDSRARRP